jgi:hypothetical protein
MGDDIPYLLDNGTGTVVELPSHYAINDRAHFMVAWDLGYMMPIKAPCDAMDVFRDEFDAASECLKKMPNKEIRYQLLHRAASAIDEGRRYSAAAAILIVHSFSATRAGWSDYADFLELFGTSASTDEVQRLSTKSKLPPEGAGSSSRCGLGVDLGQADRAELRSGEEAHADPEPYLLPALDPDLRRGSVVPLVTDRPGPYRPTGLTLRDNGHDLGL